MYKELTPNQSRYLIAPTVVNLVTSRDGNKTNVATIGNCIVLSKEPVLIGIPVSPERYTHSLIEKNKEFVINIPNQSMEHIVRYCGSVSGRAVDKVENLELTLIKGKSVGTCGIDGCLGRIECKVVDSICPGSHTLFIAEVKSAWVDKESFSKTWNFESSSPLLFDFQRYHSILKEVSKPDNESNYKIYEDMTWPEVKELVEEADKVAVIIPVGSIEQHGYGMPLKTDSYIVTQVANMAARRTKDIVLPTVYYGYNEKELDFPGTVSVKATTLIKYLEDICLSLIKVGFKKIVLINGHGWNSAIVKIVGHIINENEGVTCATLDYWNLCSDSIKDIRESQVPGGMAHACEFETSLMLALDESSVLKECLGKEISYKHIEGIAWHDLFIKSPVHIAQRFKLLSKSGVIGDPTFASKDKGEKIIGSLVEQFVLFLNEFRSGF